MLKPSTNKARKPELQSAATCPVASQGFIHLLKSPGVDHDIPALAKTEDEQAQNIFPSNSIVGDNFKVPSVRTF